ncbi:MULTISPECIES: type II toxin-antitoxin system CcdA family antitoxin [unclassified Sphingomonas]|uniref:type II toxin-antitoxin system CcdA family antitoxin n=2 Tax=unclassified Sphingomonas TaxID=196159 RepID=UPI001E55B6DD|nr:MULTISPECIES: type II toxin-antitoxin system CcdA family antitoxin [unclassified Sphingomonas]
MIVVQAVEELGHSLFLPPSGSDHVDAIISCAYSLRMKPDPVSSGKRKPVNLSLDTGVVAAAREVGLNLSQVCEAALRVASHEERQKRWRDDNREWAESVNTWVEQNGLPLERYRLF